MVIQEVDFWEATRFGLVDTVVNLLPDVNVDVAQMVGVHVCANVYLDLVQIECICSVLMWIWSIL